MTGRRIGSCWFRHSRRAAITRDHLPETVSASPPRRDGRRDLVDNRNPRFHQRARNHHPSRVVIIAVEKMIPECRAGDHSWHPRELRTPERSPPRTHVRARAREEMSVATTLGARHIPEPMAGSPLKRARKQGIRLDDGSVIAFPYMPRVADLPPRRRHFSTADKIKHLLGKISLDQARDILSWPRAELDPLRLSLQLQVMRVIAVVAGKALLDGSLDREIARVRARPGVGADGG